jgi:hypothetical protein
MNKIDAEEICYEIDMGINKIELALFSTVFQKQVWTESVSRNETRDKIK